jgi:hypothetical protein
MTRHSPARFVLAVFLAGLLTACGGTMGVDEAGDAAAASAGKEAVDPAESDDSGTPEPEDDGGDESENGEARPGGPEPEEAGGARPGGPFDVEAFEQIGQPAEDFLPFGRDYCSGGQCTLVETTEEDPNVSYCGVSSFSYDPPAQPEGASPSDQFIQRGTTVTVLITCPPEDGGTEEGTPEETTEEEVPEEEVTEEEVPEEESSEEESTEEETTEEPAA